MILKKHNLKPRVLLIIVSFAGLGLGCKTFFGKFEAEPKFPRSADILYYPFYKNSVDSTYDRSMQHANHGKLYNVIPTFDRFVNEDQAFYFTKDRKSHILTAANDILDNCGRGALSVWVKPFRLSALDDVQDSNVILSYSTDEATESAYKFSISFQTIYIDYIFNGSTQVLKVPTVIAPYQWYHLAFVANGDSLVRVFLNGKKLTNVEFARNGTSATGTEWFANITDVDQYHHFVIIGAQRRNGVPYETGFDGIIDDIRIYSQPLSPNEVLDLYLERGWRD